MHYISHLSKDKKLKKLIDLQKPFELKKKKNIHLHLCGSVMSQQLSTKVAAVIYKRFLDLFDTKSPSPEMILSIAPEKLRSIGLSNAKTGYVHNIARFSLEKGLNHVHLNELS